MSFDILFCGNKKIQTILIAFIIIVFLYNKIKFSDFWNKNIKKAKTILIYLGSGLLFGILLVIIDSIARIGNIHVGWPFSVLFYIWDAG